MDGSSNGLKVEGVLCMRIALKDIARDRLVIFDVKTLRTEIELDFGAKEVRILGMGIGLVVLMNGEHPFVKEAVERGFFSYREVGVLDVLKNFMFRLAKKIDEEEKKGTTLLDLTEFE